MRLPKKIRYYIDEFRSSVIEDKARKKILFLLTDNIIIFAAYIMAVINIIEGNNTFALINALYATSLFIVALLWHFLKIPDKIIYFTFSIISGFLILYLLITGAADGFGILWICLVPNVALIMYGLKVGSIVSFIPFITMVLLFWTPFGRKLLQFDYSNDYMIRLTVLYFVINHISYVIELIRMETQKQLEQLRLHYKHLYRHDALTKIYNRYGFAEAIEKLFPGKDVGYIAVIVIDVDNFKIINDDFGHNAGDNVLQYIAGLLLENICDKSCCCRWGGEEFLIVMACDHDPYTVAEKIRTTVERTDIPCADSTVNVTVSAGVCIAGNISKQNIEDVVNQADKALYQSKKFGKNRVTVIEKGSDFYGSDGMK